MRHLFFYNIYLRSYTNSVTFSCGSCIVVQSWSLTSGHLYGSLSGHAPYTVNSVVYCFIDLAIDLAHVPEVASLHETTYFDHLPVSKALNELTSTLSKAEHVATTVRARALQEENELTSKFNSEIAVLEQAIASLKTQRDTAVLAMHAKHV